LASVETSAGGGGRVTLRLLRVSCAELRARSVFGAFGVWRGGSPARRLTCLLGHSAAGAHSRSLAQPLNALPPASQPPTITYSKQQH
jgi:hypothetical protein